MFKNQRKSHGFTTLNSNLEFNVRIQQNAKNHTALREPDKPVKA